MELRIRFININPGYNEGNGRKKSDIISICEICRYSPTYQKEIPFPEAVEDIDECIKNGILAEFLRKNRAEVLRVSIFEYDEEEHMRQEREESRQEGFEEEGEERIAKLITILNQQRRMDDVVKMATDLEYRKKLLEEFHLD